MDELLQILQELELPFAYDHFAEGEAPEPPFVVYLLPGSHNLQLTEKCTTRSARYT